MINIYFILFTISYIISLYDLILPSHLPSINYHQPSHLISHLIHHLILPSSHLIIYHLNYHLNYHLISFPFLDNGAQIDAKEFHGQYPMHYAAVKGYDSWLMRWLMDVWWLRWLMRWDEIWDDWLVDKMKLWKMVGWICWFEIWDWFDDGWKSN